MTRFYLLHRAIRELGDAYQTRITLIGESLDGFPRIRNHDLRSWATPTSSSSAPGTDILGPVHEGDEDEAQEAGTSGNLGTWTCPKCDTCAQSYILQALAISSRNLVKTTTTRR